MEESLQERIHYLKVYVELKLSEQIKGNKGHKKEIIDKFIEGLPENLKSIKNCRKIVEETLAKEEKAKEENREISFPTIREEDRYGGKLPPPRHKGTNQNTSYLRENEGEER